MANTSKLFFPHLLLLICILRGGLGAPCGPSGVTIRQRRTGAVVEGNPEYEVSVSNSCRWCSQSNVVLRCYGLSSVEAVDRRAIRPVDDERCIVAEGRPLTWMTPVKFKYAWMTPQDFQVLSTRINCKFDLINKNV